MRIANYVQDSIVDGPGFRFTLFVQGCPHHCAGCHNPQTHDFDGGREETVDSILHALLSNPLTDGLTLSGGEPFAQPDDCAKLAEEARKHGLNVWAYSGWTFEELMQDVRPGVRKLLEQCDVLVDGRFVQEEKSLGIKWRGSRNQRLIDVPKSLKSGIAEEIEAC